MQRFEDQISSTADIIYLKTAWWQKQCIYSCSCCGTYHRCYIQRAAATSTLIWLHVILIQLHPILKPENNMVSILNYKPKMSNLSKLFFTAEKPKKTPKKPTNEKTPKKKTPHQQGKCCQDKEMHIMLLPLYVHSALNTTYLIDQLTYSYCHKHILKTHYKFPFLCVLVFAQHYSTSSDFNLVTKKHMVNVKYLQDWGFKALSHSLQQFQ